MYKKVIVSLALDHGIGQTAIEAARSLVDKGGEIIAVHVYEPLHGSVSTYVTDEAVATALQKTKDRLAERVAGSPDVKALLLKGHSGRVITDYAKECGADCIVIGSHKPGLSDYFLGSTAARIVRHAPCSVHVLR
ncbi:universal stress protein [Pseudohalocynthiibacter aestuariivivens]|jgi:nucleotide-binding universal stress UspA family protein|uniref:Universal stress protein n=1 Tax=Pseudohalocynthiibacter aestuariivivens TaxID=1591409 RepID=A0ABV5JF69_9RHOB|nr:MULTISPECIES: universal stress protein [Pseudohalocynthiibacter]MBS9717082.1 universal stress protein [Pseudohalocynthiibacter aestuariivivens]MCK0103994.1 universal stress protein [Pseudohalocynthiibacter sp. F2068]